VLGSTSDEDLFYITTADGEMVLMRVRKDK
jgi:hypothetical protein